MKPFHAHLARTRIEHLTGIKNKNEAHVVKIISSATDNNQIEFNAENAYCTIAIHHNTPPIVANLKLAQLKLALPHAIVHIRKKDRQLHGHAFGW